MSLSGLIASPTVLRSDFTLILDNLSSCLPSVGEGFFEWLAWQKSSVETNNFRQSSNLLYSSSIKPTHTPSLRPHGNPFTSNFISIMEAYYNTAAPENQPCPPFNPLHLKVKFSADMISIKRGFLVGLLEAGMCRMDNCC